MKKVFATIFSIIAILISILFFITLNINSTISSPKKAKDIMVESNFYSTLASYIRDQIVDGTDYSLDEGSNFESLNQVINADSVKNTIEKTIDNTYLALQKPESANLIFPVVFTGGNDQASFNFEKKVNLNNNPIFDNLVNINKIIILLGVLSGFFALIAILLFSKEARGRMLAFGNISLILGLLIIATKLLTDLLLPNYYHQFINSFDLVREQKLVIGVGKFIDIFFKKQIIFYLIETVTLISIGLIAIFLSKAFNKEKLKDIIDKFTV